jgi:hypothetical protein
MAVGLSPSHLRIKRSGPLRGRFTMTLRAVVSLLEVEHLGGLVGHAGLPWRRVGADAEPAIHGRGKSLLDLHEQPIDFLIDRRGGDRLRGFL